MTAAPLPVVAGWDVPLLRGAVGTLDLVAERLLPWRYRLDDLGRRIGDAECWSGPAGSAAAAALVELSSAASRVTGALSSSLQDLQGLGAAAAEAQELAERAQALAASAGLALDEGGRAVGVPLPHPLMSADQAADVAAAARAATSAQAAAEGASDAAARAGECARAAAEPLGVLGAPGPVAFPELVARLPGTTPPPVPVGGDPEEAASWWSALTATQQRAAIGTQPGAVGALDGLPGWARDEANRLGLAAALQHLPPGSAGWATASAVHAQLAEVEEAGAVAQLLQFDPAADLVALSVGDVDTAGAVGVLVPGIETTPADDLRGLVGDARDVAAAAVAAAPGLAVATVAWLGYRTPGWRTSWSSGAADRGGPVLDRALDGLAAARATAARTAVSTAPPRTTVLAHSYGTVVTGRAVQAPGRLAADAVVLLGSPGVPAGRAGDLEVEEVHGAWTPVDVVSQLRRFGPTPFDPSFGDVGLPTDPTQGHTRYYDRDRPTLAAIGQVVAGTRASG
ncbi:alpha/beta hydrolase [Modestobacter sp. VKM Ac-2986]|uniref:alpha/beta hydrolase n=1 Tax=Modestobacter sp. VKM Ac-2986 TaxID=3004140 RepID=UPI0022AB6105|nr:alpha/beta hydrolase [Modestobacter sp. VKM Ac-2986]MCZ2830035.1 alpha/beta hydrolase [Modestobacter sp. VKM Ac-2986]